MRFVTVEHPLIAAFPFFPHGSRGLIQAGLMLALVSLLTASAAQGQTFVETSIPSSLDGPRAVVTEDINDDGAIDVVSAALSGDAVAWYESDGSPAPSFTEHVIDASTLDGPRDVHVADVDGDGDLDILAVSLEPDDGNLEDDGKVVWYENDGAETPSFTTHEITDQARRARSVATADVNDNGHLDIVVAAAADGEIIWFENDGGATPGFTRRTVTDAAPGVASVQARDFDGDGDVDLAAAILEGDDTIDGNRIVWYENEGDPEDDGSYAFTEHTIQANVQGAVHVAIADVDGNGTPDIISAALDDGEVAWYANDGAADPSFASHTITTSADGVLAVYPADADGDGDVDIFAAVAGDNTVRGFANNGAAAPSFQPFTVASDVDGASSVAVASLDGDPKLDVVAAANVDNEILWFKNESTVLPVELVQFEAVTERNEAVLRWRTLSETNNDGFAVERRTTTGFEQIGYVRGEGTTTEAQSYQFRTDPLDPGTHVFRLKQVDRGGTSAYSDEVEVHVAMAQAFTLTGAYPNPFRSETQLDLRVREAQHVEVGVYDFLGRRVETLYDGEMQAGDVQVLTLDGSRLASGTYLIRAVGERFEENRKVTLVR